MKVFLMYPDRDFGSERKLVSDEKTLVQDLELNTLFETMAQEDKYIFQAAQQAILYSLDNLDTINYRQEILKDCLKHPEIVRQIYNMLIQSIINNRGRWLSISSSYPSGILHEATSMLELFVELLKAIKQIADEHTEQFESRGLRRFFTMIQQELDDDYFTVITTHLNELKFRRGVSLSAELGRANRGANYILRRPSHKNQNWIQQVITSRKSPEYSYTLDQRDWVGAQALGELRNLA